MNGTPLVSSVCAFEERSSGTAGLLSMPVKNDAVSADISTAPASAVPIEMPEVGEGVLEAADLAALLVGHRGDGHRAELRRERADAETGEEHRPGDDLGTGAGVERGDEHDETEEQHEEPELADPPRRRVREQLGDPDRGDHQGDRQRQDPDAGVDRREPERDREEQRHREEQAGLEQVLEEERGEPAAQQPDPQDRGIEQRRPGRCRAGASPTRGTRAAPRPRRGSARSPARAPTTSARPASAARTPTCPSAGSRRRSGPSPSAESAGADEVEAGAFLLRRVGGAPVEEEDDADDEHLADEHVAPRPVRGEEPADQRTDRDRDRAARRHDAVGARPIGLARSSTPPAPRSPASPSAAPTPSRNDQPNINTGEVRATARSSTIRTRRSRSRS